MKKPLTRRDFLKLTGTLSLGAVTPRYLLDPKREVITGEARNVLIIVFDALSAYHLSMYGYARETMPNLSRLAEKAVVYHNHYAAGNYTTPGTASLLTGLLPWTHRAFLYNARIAEALVKKNIFNAFSDYYRMAYSHNKYVNTFLRQFQDDIDKYTPREDLFLRDPLLVGSFVNDEDMSSIGWARSLNQKDEGYTYSLLFSRINSLFQAAAERKMREYRKEFPRGIPKIKRLESYFVLEHAIDFLTKELMNPPEPYFGYFHFLPPHYPYNTRSEFYQAFENDGYQIPEKPMHVFSRTGSHSGSHEEIDKLNTYYDEFILYVDSEFARLFDFMERSGILENTWLILTSDHGELFERGISGHTTELLTQPIVRVPLLIFEPGRDTRLDIFESTSAIDILPTLLRVTGQDIPKGQEGVVLPPYSDGPTKNDREIFAIQSIVTNDDEPIDRASIMLVRDNMKLVYFFGYDELDETGELIELYDVKADPQELTNLYPAHKSIADEMVAIVKSKLKEADRPYR